MSVGYEVLVMSKLLMISIGKEADISKVMSSRCFFAILCARLVVEQIISK